MGWEPSALPVVAEIPVHERIHGPVVSVERVELPRGALMTRQLYGEVLVGVSPSFEVVVPGSPHLTGAVHEMRIVGLRVYRHEFDSVGRPVDATLDLGGWSTVADGTMTILPGTPRLTWGGRRLQTAP